MRVEQCHRSVDLADLELLVVEAASLVDEIVPDGEGACLGTSAILARVLTEQGITTTAVRGTYEEHAHWWLETDDFRADATRWQFDRDAALVEPLVEDEHRDESPYSTERSFPSAWTSDQAVDEFARMFQFHDVGVRHGRHVLELLRHFAAQDVHLMRNAGPA